MVLFTDAQTYFEQSKLLLQARPSTVRSPPRPILPPVPLTDQLLPSQTKISTKYTLPKPTAAHAKSAARRASKAAASAATSSETTAASALTPAATSKAVLTLRTYDPVSGTVLKYQTDKQAEVGRLIAGLGRCARTMAALPEEAEMAQEAEQDGGQGPVGAAVEKVVGAVVSAEGTPRAGTPVQGGQQQQQQGKAGGGAGKKKGKKGKK